MKNFALILLALSVPVQVFAQSSENPFVACNENQSLSDIFENNEVQIQFLEAMELTPNSRLDFRDNKKGFMVQPRNVNHVVITHDENAKNIEAGSVIAVKAMCADGDDLMAPMCFIVNKDDRSSIQSMSVHGRSLKAARFEKILKIKFLCAKKN